VPRLHELIARNLDVTKTVARRLIEDGDVQEPGAPAGSELRNPRLEIPAARLPLPVIIEGEPVLLREHMHLMQHKPVGVVTALRDDRHPVAYDLLENAPLFPHLRAVGRLDLDTSGLLLWTTDGALLQRLTHPKRAIARTYQAALARPFEDSAGDLVLDDGHRPVIRTLSLLHPERDEGVLHPALARPADATVYATITIVGGAYHEVRRIFAALGSHVLALCRTSFGNLALPRDLPAGEHREIDPAEVSAKTNETTNETTNE
jgi:16S rRNA pseudouridine516 synthase